jgi:hypothetical protein
MFLTVTGGAPNIPRSSFSSVSLFFVLGIPLTDAMVGASPTWGLGRTDGYVRGRA